ncbi:hypothetical protein [Pacificibacter marinus]|uniref:Aldehyde dehydrogenase family protein n=1 Tax=Pacificibacter marinus TaxID=658057 RepID=A0A1Y5RSX0_9RHOB|nr:hypothetical protein [Pacificibacter marinus]SEL30630.1 NADP-dependent aldehyde dehydrogenase [Pacificibacter marinus]SLN22012.1 hypothetical protein PAM7971_00651 [Pacificibacter marinus]
MKHKHLVAGQWIGGVERFANEPVSGTADAFAVGTVELVEQACEAAEVAFESYGNTSRTNRATFLRKIAEEIDARGVNRRVKRGQIAA